MGSQRPKKLQQSLVAQKLVIATRSSTTNLNLKLEDFAWYMAKTSTGKRNAPIAPTQSLFKKDQSNQHDLTMDFPEVKEYDKQTDYTNN
ncbi:MAG: hypothetical protein ABSF44_08845 [Candidatus Bathyarchaeia archaeon]|jgi:hypothetical protein